MVRPLSHGILDKCDTARYFRPSQPTTSICNYLHCPSAFFDSRAEPSECRVSLSVSDWRFVVEVRMKHNALVVALLAVLASMSFAAVSWRRTGDHRHARGRRDRPNRGSAPGRHGERPIHRNGYHPHVDDGRGRPLPGGRPRTGAIRGDGRVDGIPVDPPAGHPAQRRPEPHLERHDRRRDDPGRGDSQWRVADYRHDQLLDFRSRRRAADSRAAAQRSGLQPVDAASAGSPRIADDVAAGGPRDGDPGLGRRRAAQPD